jgi:hypothetical protein
VNILVLVLEASKEVGLEVNREDQVGQHVDIGRMQDRRQLIHKD